MASAAMALNDSSDDRSRMEMDDMEEEHQFRSAPKNQTLLMLLT
jgi:hypothetical protein